MLVVEGKEIRESERARFHFFEKQPGRVPLIAPGRVDAILEDQPTEPKCWRSKNEKGR